MKIRLGELRRIIRGALEVLEEGSLVERGEVYELESDIVLVHRTQDAGLKLGDLDPLAVRVTKQGKRTGEPKVGLYAYEAKDDVPRYGENKIEFILPTGTVVLDLTGAGRGVTSRVTLSEAQELLSHGIKAVKGYDYIGPVEWVVLDLS